MTKQCNDWPSCACGRGGPDNCGTTRTKLSEHDVLRAVRNAVSPRSLYIGHEGRS